MDKQTGPNDFLVVLPGEIIEMPQDSDKSWLTLFYSLPRELAEKWKPAYELPRCPYEVLRTDKYDCVVCDDMLCEEKDLLQEEYGLVHCSIDEFQAIPFNSVKYKKENAYGVEAMVLRNAVPSDIHISPISIEELFVFMVKEAK